MQDIAALIEWIKRDERGVRLAGARYELDLRSAGEAAGAPEVIELADALCEALARDGAWGLVDLALAGPALGGLHEREVGDILAIVEGWDRVPA